MPLFPGNVLINLKECHTAGLIVILLHWIVYCSVLYGVYMLSRFCAKFYEVRSYWFKGILNICICQESRLNRVQKTYEVRI